MDHTVDPLQAFAIPIVAIMDVIPIIVGNLKWGILIVGKPEVFT